MYQGYKLKMTVIYEKVLKRIFNYGIKISRIHRSNVGLRSMLGN